jgi:hypothetical protein
VPGGAPLVGWEARRQERPRPTAKAFDHVTVTVHGPAGNETLGMEYVDPGPGAPTWWIGTYNAPGNPGPGPVVYQVTAVADGGDTRGTTFTVLAP